MEKWVSGCAAQKGCLFDISGLPMALLYLKIGLDLAQDFAKCLILMNRLSKSTYASKFTW